MLVVSTADQLMCREFFPTLIGATQRWFMSLPPGSIYSFEELVKCFLLHFAGSMKTMRHFMHLSTVKQRGGGGGEPLRKFLARWQKETQMVEGLDDKSALALFMEALQVGFLYESLRNDTLPTYALAIKRTNRYVNTEEAMEENRK